MKRLIDEETRKGNIYLVDLSNLLGHQHFFDLYGHCEPEGRQKIAEALAPEILKLIESTPRSTSSVGSPS